MPAVIRMRRPDASKYLKEVHGLDYAETTLAKFACIGGGPEMEYAGRFPTYTPAALDDFARSKISPPVRSTSELHRLRQAQAA